MPSAAPPSTPVAPVRPADEATGPPHRRSGARIAIVTIVLVTVAYWLFVFSGGGVGKNPDFLSDRRWATAAERACKVTRAQIEALPDANSTRSKQERAEVIRRADADLRALLDRLGARVPAGSDGEVVRAWIRDYRTYVADREEYARRLPGDARTRFLVTDRSGKPVDEVIDNFAALNEMPSCMTPGDVG